MTKHERDQLKDVLDGIVFELRAHQRLLDKTEAMQALGLSNDWQTAWCCKLQLGTLQTPAEGICSVLGLRLVAEERKDLDSLKDLMYSEPELAAKAFDRGCSRTVYKLEKVEG